MSSSTSSIHWQGFGLSLLTAVLWGILPLFLKLCVEVIDPITITVVRFFTAGLFVYMVLLKTKAVPRLSGASTKTKYLVLVASLLLAVNYVANVQGLGYLNPETAQVVMQLAPLMLMLGGVVFYSEALNRVEILGACLLVFGLLLFFNTKLPDLWAATGSLTFGVLLIGFAAVTWAAYALVQKQILGVLSAKQLTLYIYITGVLVLLPFVTPLELDEIQGIHWFALAFCCFNTIVGYGAFTEALAIWQAAKVGAVISLAPVFTFLSMYLAVEWYPEYFSMSNINTAGYIGAGIVVLGSVMASLGKARQGKSNR